MYSRRPVYLGLNFVIQAHTCTPANTPEDSGFIVLALIRQFLVAFPTLPFQPGFAIPLHNMQAVRTEFLTDIAVQLFPDPAAAVSKPEQATMSGSDSPLAWLEARASKSMEDQLESAFSSTELMMSRGSVRRLLEPGAWYNDEILNAWGHIQQAQYQGRFHILESHFYEKLLHGYDQSRIVRWFMVSIPRGSRMSLVMLTFVICQNARPPCNPFLDVDRLLILHNRRRNHWAVASINFPSRSIEYFDSMECDQESRDQVQEVRTTLRLVS